MKNKYNYYWFITNGNLVFKTTADKMQYLLNQKHLQIEIDTKELNNISNINRSATIYVKCSDALIKVLA